MSLKRHQKNWKSILQRKSRDHLLSLWWMKILASLPLRLNLKVTKSKMKPLTFLISRLKQKVMINPCYKETNPIQPELKLKLRPKQKLREKIDLSWIEQRRLDMKMKKKLGWRRSKLISPRWKQTKRKRQGSKLK